ncbi:hypothetical protein WN944_029683 [Citrus x changshan-huyou]|uniref:Large ribosomal subunit protein uL15/eL18 domain-containing protein n=1 Tax=Citrus x changshan-huyou TaxID=2935761 RepID=A0AAP0LG59_9ROSI
MVPQEVKAKASKDNVPMIDVTQFGYFKVLSKGDFPENQLVVVKAELFSKTAEKKIKEAGGSMIQNLGIEESEVSEAICYDFDNGDYHRSRSVTTTLLVGSRSVTTMLVRSRSVTITLPLCLLDHDPLPSRFRCAC